MEVNKIKEIRLGLRHNADILYCAMTIDILSHKGQTYLNPNRKENNKEHINGAQLKANMDTTHPSYQIRCQLFSLLQKQVTLISLYLPVIKSLNKKSA